MPSAKEIGKRLLELRGDMAREKVANAAGTSVSAISMYENGERVPRDAIKIKLAAFYKKAYKKFFSTKIVTICDKNIGVNQMDFAEEEQNERKCGKEHAH